VNDQELLEIAQGIARDTGVPAPHCVIIREPRTGPGALSNYFLGVTLLGKNVTHVRLHVGRMLLENAPDPVLEALIAHEIGHLLKPVRLPRRILELVTVLATSWAALIACVLTGVVGVALDSDSVTGAAGAAASCVLLLNAVTGTMSRRDEYAADRFAASVVGEQQVMLALAWMGGVDPLPDPPFPISLVLTHPSKAARIRRLDQLATGAAA
jgi:Zn-dependent protease with chaperone function